MPKKKAQCENKQACAWMIAVPMRAEFIQPLFHFGERVKWLITAETRRFWLSGRIMGLWFSKEMEGWQYVIQMDKIKPPPGTELDETAIVEEIELQLVNDADAIRHSLTPPSDWQTTDLAAQALGLSPDQLRKLRLKGCLREGYHVRDASLPNKWLNKINYTK
jgi:hypothetical protein